jgi:3-hydroxyacyl-CoA dehydrogenase
MTIKSVGICGSGIMGSGIAEVAAKSGYEVMVCEIGDKALSSGLGKVQKSLAKAVERGKLAADDLRADWAHQRLRDRAAGRTLAGPHRDELDVSLAGKAMPAAQCSTGEQ